MNKGAFGGAEQVVLHGATQRKPQSFTEECKLQVKASFKYMFHEKPQRPGRIHLELCPAFGRRAQSTHHALSSSRQASFVSLVPLHSSANLRAFLSATP